MALPVRFLREAFDDPLRPVGFSRVGRRQVWLRQRPSFAHAVSVETYSTARTVRWDIVNPAVGMVLHGRLAEPADVPYTGFVTGTAQATAGGVVSRFGSGDVDDRAVVVGVAAAATQVAGWMATFATTSDVINFLTQRPGEPLRDARVTVPTNWPLRVFTAAALATVEHHEQAEDLVEVAISAMAPFGEIDRQRIQRLVAART